MNAYMLNISVEAIGPREAEAYLKRKTSDDIDWTKVEEYADIMVAGKWGYPGGCIEIDVKGRLKNGHHRLLAVVMTGVTLPMIVVRGVTVNREV